MDTLLREKWKQSMFMLGEWLVYQFCGYQLMYNSRGHKDDFAALTVLNVDLKGKIALANYGGPFRGVKVLNAEAHGMVGVIMFSDPGDDGPQEAKGQVAYPRMTTPNMTDRRNICLTSCRWSSAPTVLHTARIRRVHPPLPR